MQKIKKISTVFVASILCLTFLTFSAFAATVDIFSDYDLNFFDFYEKRTAAQHKPSSGTSVVFSGIFQNEEKNSTKAEVMASSASYTDVVAEYKIAFDQEGNWYDHYLTSAAPYNFTCENGKETTIAIKEGETINFTPFIQALSGGSPIKYEGDDKLPLYEIENLSFVEKCYSGKVLNAKFNQDDFSYDFLSYKTSGNAISVEKCDNSGSAIKIKANKAGSQTISVILTGMYSMKEYMANETSFVKAILPKYDESYMDDWYNTYIRQQIMFRYTINFNVEVYSKDKSADFIIEDSKINDLNEVYEDCDFAVAADALMPISASLNGYPYSAPIKCDANVVSVAHPSNGYLSTRTLEKQELKFISSSTKVYNIDFGGVKKKIKIISSLGSFDKFKTSNISALNSYLKDEGVLIKVGKEESMASLVSSAMNDITGSTNYGIPMFPSSKSLKIDEYDSKFLKATKYDRLKAIEETPETNVTLSIGDTILYVNVATTKTPTSFFVIPTTVGSFAELKNKSLDELKELAITDNYTMYQESDMNVYILQYPRMNKSVNVSIPYGSSVASISETDTPHMYKITTSKTDNYFTIRMTEKEDNSSASLRMHVMYINTIGLDPLFIDITYNMMSNLQATAGQINGYDDVQALYESAMSEATSNAYNKTKTKKLTLYVNDSKYSGNVYYVIQNDNNNNISSTDWHEYSDSNGIHSGVYKGKGTVNLKISYNDKKAMNSSITLYAFLSPPDGKTSINDMLKSGRYAECKISIKAGAEDADNTKNLDIKFGSYEYPFTGLIPYNDAENSLTYYYGVDLTPKYKTITVKEDDWETVPIYGTTYAVIPMKIKSIHNGTVKTVNGKSYAFSTNKNVYALSVVPAGNASPDSGDLYTQKAAADGISTMDVDDLTGADYDFYVWVRVDCPCSVRCVTSVSCTATYSNGKVTYTDWLGGTYDSSKAKFAVMTYTVKNSDGTTGTMGMKIGKYSYDNGKVYVTGTIATGENKKVEYTGQRVMIAVEKDIPVICPESSAPSVTSKDSSIATAEMKQPNYGQLQYEKVRLLVEIDGISAGKTTVTVYDYSGNTCDIEVTVPDEFKDDEDDSIVTKHYTVEGTNRGKKYYFDYYFSVPKTVNLKVGESISVPVTASVTGSNPTYADIKDPYSEIKVNIPSSYKGNLDASFDGHEIELTGLKKGNYTITVWGYKNLIHYDMIVKVE